MKIIITGGGTGGHIYPGISLARALQKRDTKNEIIFIGSKHGMESEIIPQEGFQFLTINVRGVRRKICLESFYAILLFFASLAKAFNLIKRIKPDLVIGTGGYVSGSVALISSIMGIPTFIHEQNAIPGITNQVLSLTCKAVYISFPESENYFWRKNKTIYLGNPVRGNIWKGDRMALLKRTNLDNQKKTILIFGGSKGASVINRTLLDCLDLLHLSFWTQWQILMISGEDDYLQMKEKISQNKHRKNICLMPYLNQIEDAYAMADLVVARAGATTVAELTAKGLPSILIPYPYATRDHQLYNARYLEKKHAAVVIPQNELSEKKLADELSDLMHNQQRLNLLAHNSKESGNRKAAEEIISSIYGHLKKEKKSGHD